MGLPHKSKSFAVLIPVMLLPLVAALCIGIFFLFPVGTGAVNGCSVAVSRPVSSGNKVMVSGAPIGIRMQSEGVLVTGFIGFLSQNNQYVSPGKDAGLRIGDRILSIDGVSVIGTDSLVETVSAGKGCSQVFVVERDGSKLNMTVTACREDQSNVYKIGLWVKDGAAGIGTLTFYDQETGFFGALGHGITDMESGALYTISGGQLLNAAITDVVKGKIGCPGELRGYFTNSRRSLGRVICNEESGVYGILEKEWLSHFSGREMPIGEASSVHPGKATIFTTLGSGEPKEYQIEIQRVNKEKVTSAKGLVIQIVDPELLDVAGGIVQGMSGSPIIQDGKLIGAVTHVMINDPTTGYGIFIEGMLQNQESVLQKQN